MIAHFWSSTWSATTFAADVPYPWPNNALAAVSLSYDDALNSQLDNAIPALDKHGFKGSFYLTLTSPVFNTRKLEWQKIAKHGHELGNHTIHHACRKSLPNRGWVASDNNLDNVSVSKIVAEIKTANTILKQLDNQSKRTFTVPCTDNLANGADYLEAITPLFVGIKSKVGTTPKSMDDVDIKRVSVISAENLTGKQLISLVREARSHGTMVNFTFHGIGGDHLSISSKAHNALLSFLAKNKADYWIDTFLNISLHITLQQE
ncbi:polysaccharide deacetylase [Colwellia sp. 75C3]|nr:polysaccharide deacetylase [Colwellia sp. 75C3]